MTHLQSLTNAADKSAVAEANFEKLDTRILRGAADLDFGSINAGAQVDLTIAVANAAAGDIALVGFPSAPTGGIVFIAYVSAAGIVTIRASNITAAPLNPGSGTFRVMVLRY